MATFITDLFGFSKTPKVTKKDKAVLAMKQQRDNLKRYRKRIQVILDQETQLAKEALRAGNQEKARRALRKRKYQESLLQQTDGQLEQLEQLVSSVEFALVEASVLHGLKQGNEVLAQLHKEMDIESVEKLMSETMEAIEYQKEIDAMLSSNMNAIEEEEVMNELLAIQTEILGPALPILPEVPVKELGLVKGPVETEPQKQPESRVAYAAQ
ncbi:Vacuolar protein sorting-associated protein 20 [Serendipita sp. 411]|nr:Vacuolar protein sorting-associated protein 20 [Serendipita sp. 401]KAG8851730.1 Vacuolar protein sorting-associated protein 20 [Serendipita sp. 411]